MNEQTNKRPPTGILVVGAVIVLGLLGVYATVTRDAPFKEPRPASQAPLVSTGTQSVTVPRTEIRDGELVVTGDPRRVQEGEDALLVALNGFLEGAPAVPKAARAKTVVVGDGVATVDFTKEILAGYGTDDESTVLNGILAALGQFKGVNRARFTVEGQPIDTLGHSDLSAPVEVLRGKATTSRPPN